MGATTSHRKSQSLDAANETANSVKRKSYTLNEKLVFFSLFHISHITTVNFCFLFRFKCIVSYPPNSEFELELAAGDLVFVHKKRENGWYKGKYDFIDCLAYQ